MPEKTRQRRAGSPRRASGGRRPAAPKKKKPTSNAKPLTPVLDPPDIESFAEFTLVDEIQTAITEMGIVKPTPIQALAIQPVLDGKDVIAKAETGTGKTLAFGAPMMSKIDPDRSSVLGLVLSPTRELAEQVHDVLEKLGEARGVKTALVVGGEPLGPQVKKLQAGAQVVVGTPGRVLDLLGQRFLQFPWTEFAILDEADKMLEIGFIDDVKKILDACNEYRQTLLFSATFPPPLLDLARGYTGDPVEIATASGVATVDTINQYLLRCDEADRARNLAHLIEDSGPDDVFLTFCERRTDVDRLMRQLERRRFSVKALHGGYDQAARFRVMGAFRTGDVKCLVATDVASRGLDVKHVTHVVNLGVPRDVSDYTHRIGRTGRAGRKGVAITFVSRKDERGFKHLLDQSGFDIEEISRPRELFAKEAKAARADRAADAEDVEGEARDERERPRRTRRPRRDTEDAAEPRGERPRRSRRPRSDDEGDETPRRERRPRRPRRDEDDGERPARRERRPRREESADSPPARSKGREEPRERPRKRRRERPADDAPTSGGDGGFGLGLDSKGPAGPEERPKRKRRSRRADGDEAPRRKKDDRETRDRDSGESNGKARPKRPKRSAEGDNGARRSASKSEAPRRSGGFGAGL